MPERIARTPAPTFLRAPVAHRASGLHGRDHDLARLKQIVEAPTPEIRVVEISGDPWMGKTRLLNALGHLASDHGWTVAYGAAGPLPEKLPFGVFADALDDLLVSHHDDDLLDGFPAHHASWLAGIFPALGSHASSAAVPKSPSETHHAFRAVRALLERLASANRLLLIIDDAHWADATSIDLLNHLVRHPPATDVLLAVAYRPRQAPGSLRTLLGEAAMAGLAAGIEMPPLAEEDIGAMLPDGLNSFRRHALYEVSAGNPGLLRALAAAEEALGEARADEISPFLNPHVVLQRDFRDLSPLGWAVAQSAAVVCEPFGTELLEEVAQMSKTEIWTGVDELILRDVLRLAESERTFRFRDPLLRAAAYQSAGAAWRLSAHERAAAALTRRKAPAPEIAQHLRHSASAGDEGSVSVLLAAARATLWVRPQDAASWTQAAMDLRRRDGNHTGEQVLLATALAVTGRLTESLALFGEVPHAVRGHGESVVWHAQVLRLLGRHTQAGELLRAALAAVPAAEITTRAQLSAALLATLLESGDAPEMPEDGIADNAHMSLDPAPRVLLLALLAMVDASLGRTVEGESRIREAAKLADDLPDDTIVPQLECLYWLGRSETSLKQDGAALCHLERVLNLAVRHHLHYIVPQIATMLGGVLLRLGDRTGAGFRADHAEYAARSIGSDFLLRHAKCLQVQVDHAGEMPLGEGAGTPAGTTPATADPADRADQDEEIKPEMNRLSVREREIAVLVSEGRTNQQIARALGLSHKTVETYLARIFKKLKFVSRAQLATMVGRSLDREPVTA